MELWELDETIRSICPIDGVNSDGVIFFREEATDAARDAAQLLMDKYLSELA